MNISTAVFGLFSALRRPQFLSQVIGQDFVPWALWDQPKRILRCYVEYARACAEILSITFLLQTLVSPWKGISEAVPSVIRWDQFLQAFFVNLVTRGIGMVIRLMAIALSLTLQILLLAVFVILSVGWYVLPFAALVALSFALVIL